MERVASDLPFCRPDRFHTHMTMVIAYEVSVANSGQQSVKRPVTDTESRLQTGGDQFEMGTGESTILPRAPSASIRRRIAVKSQPAAVTTQEAVDGYRGKSDEDRECRTRRIGQHHGVVNHGSRARVDLSISVKWAR